MAWTWSDLKASKKMVRVYRSWAVSAYMKSIRLRRPDDALYWLGVLWEGHAGLPYLRRRVFSSAGEDNLDVWIMEVCEKLLLENAKDPEAFAWGTYLACLGTKWYELPDGIEYTEARARAAEAPHAQPPFTTGQELYARYDRALGAGDVEDAFWCIAEGRAMQMRMVGFYSMAADAGAHASTDQARRLAAIIQRQIKWLGYSREKNHLWQLVYALCRRPLTSMERQPDRKEFEKLWSKTKLRLAKPLERPPSWALDGIHTTGSDPRFAGSFEGLRNMIAMHARDGKIDPARPTAVPLERLRRK